MITDRNPMNFKESMDWLNGFQKFGMKLGLERIIRICSELDNPQNNYKVIHVGGTNGKGSVCKFLESILISNGYSVGVYTSPHLQNFSERIVVNGEEISEDDVVTLIKKIKPVIEKISKKDDSPTYFEIVTAMTFQCFSDKKIDFAIVEVGLGGRYDATNIVEPLVTVITNVSLEHKNVLGKKIENIAFEKAGIVKNNIPVVTGAGGKALEVIEKIANEKNAPINLVSNHDWERFNCDLDGQEFHFKGFLKDYDVRTSLIGKYQGENIGLTLAVVEILQMNGCYISDESILDGISKTVYIGRMEIIGRDPIILLDGAHNPKGMEKLVEALNNDFKFENLILVIGILSDKDIKSILSMIIPLANVIVVTKSKNTRACDPIILKNMIKALGYDNEVIDKEDVSSAVKYAKSIAEKNDLVCVTGSLFTVGEARDFLL